MANERNLATPDIRQTTDYLQWPLGTRFFRGDGPFRYALAGGSIKADHPAYSYFSFLPADWHLTAEEFIVKEEWGNMRAEGKEGQEAQGWPVEDVEKGQYFWLREKVLP